MQRRASPYLGSLLSQHSGVHGGIDSAGTCARGCGGPGIRCHHLIIVIIRLIELIHHHVRPGANMCGVLSARQQCSSTWQGALWGNH
jgi:hypothetical protein